MAESPQLKQRPLPSLAVAVRRRQTAQDSLTKAIGALMNYASTERANRVRSEMPKREILAISLLISGVLVSHAEESLRSVDPNDGWKFATKSNDVTIYTRVRAGSPIKEFKAIGAIDAPTSLARRQPSAAMSRGALSICPFAI